MKVKFPKFQHFFCRYYWRIMIGDWYVSPNIIVLLLTFNLLTLSEAILPTGVNTVKLSIWLLEIKPIRLTTYVVVLINVRSYYALYLMLMVYSDAFINNFSFFCLWHCYGPILTVFLYDRFCSAVLNIEFACCLYNFLSLVFH